MGEILADFSVQNPIIDSLVIGLNVKEKRKQASLAQQVEREICNFDVVGSIPTGGSTMNYNDDLKVVWITPMRTGTRSSGTIMSKLKFKSDNNGIHQKETVHGIGIPEGKEDYKLIVNIRNPYSRMVSLYYLYLHNSKQFNQVFDRWVKSSLSFSDYNKNLFILENLKKLPKLPDFYIRMENFEDDIKSLWFVKENFDFLEQTLKHNIEKNCHDLHEFQINGFIKKESWKEYYNEEISEFVYKKMKNEFDFFNYDKNSWK